LIFTIAIQSEHLAEIIIVGRFSIITRFEKWIASQPARYIV